jgi:hypothetical protein
VLLLLLLLLRSPRRKRWQACRSLLLLLIGWLHACDPILCWLLLLMMMRCMLVAFNSHAGSCSTLGVHVIH